MVDEILVDLSPRLKKLYSKIGRPSIPPEKLLRALLLQTLYSIRSERQLMEQLDYNLLFRWFVGLNMDDCVWDATTFCKNRERLLKGDIATAFSEQVLARAQEHDLLSEEHFTVDGTPVEAAASLKSFKNKDDQDGQRRGMTNRHHRAKRGRIVKRCAIVAEQTNGIRPVSIVQRRTRWFEVKESQW
jgi:transposase